MKVFTHVGGVYTEVLSNHHTGFVYMNTSHVLCEPVGQTVLGLSNVHIQFVKVMATDAVHQVIWGAIRFNNG